MQGKGFRGALLVVLVGTLVLPVGPASARTRKRHTRATTASPALAIRVLSNRADLISGGDALVAIDGVGAQKPRVTVGGRDATTAFSVRPNGRFEGLVSGLAVGANVLTATLPGGTGSRLTIENHPNGGPVFSGPQIKPWVCQNGSKDPQCSAPTTYAYEYKSSTDGQLHPYDPGNPPSDVADTTTQTGATVPFIIRIETGYQDRDQYKIAALYQPGKPWAAWAPQPQFNHKLLITHGASCAIDHESSTAPSVTGDTVLGDSPTIALGEGFGVMSTALDNAGHNCNVVTQAESLVMAKEHFIEQYGELRYTIGTGCSGGSLAQQQISNAYPGIYQGILPQCSFPDAWTAGQELAYDHFGRLYFEHPDKWGPGVVWTPAEIAAVEGHPNHLNAVIFDTTYWNALANPSGGATNSGVDQSNGCGGVTRDEEYDAQNNPGGVRCTLADYMINVFGPRSPADWSPNEKKLGHGFAGLPIGDVGVQFGLEALKSGQITTAQFVDLNAKAGGADIDLNPIPQRSDATEPALERAYRSGAVNETNNQKDLAIIDLRGPDPGAFHDAYRSWTIRARLEQVEGHFPKNDVIWFGETPLIGDPNYSTEGLQAMDRWLSAVEADHRNISREQKVAEDKPADIKDRCSNVDGLEKVDVPGVGEVCQMPLLQTRFATPAMIAGEDIRTDILRCQLAPLRPEDYYPIQFTDAQWKQLEDAFPAGVCDWRKPGVSQQPTIPWQTYQDPSGNVIYGGRPLGAAPSSSRVAAPVRRSSHRTRARHHSRR
ncbi:MAG: DUF6351 family protein [Thermoleophilaceae bacterium]